MAAEAGSHLQNASVPARDLPDGLHKIPYGQDLHTVAACPVPSRLDDHIRQLCIKVVRARDVDLEPAISELKAALRQHTQTLRKMAAEKLVTSGSQPPDLE